MRLLKLLQGFHTTNLTSGVCHRDVQRLCLDSRELQKGDVFVALSGSIHNGESFILSAFKAGASLVLHDVDCKVDSLPSSYQSLCVGVENLRYVLGHIAGRLNGNPSDVMNVVGVTGTDGKTSTANFVAQLLELLSDQQSALIGTIGNGLLGDLSPAANTTPDAISLQSLFSAFRDQGAGAAVMEVSSHALDQGRVIGVDFDVAVLTNLARDHMDYHHSMREYAQAKLRLFKECNPLAIVVNGNDDFGCEVARQMQHHDALYVYGFGPDLPHVVSRVGGVIYAQDLQCDANGIHFSLVYSPCGDVKQEAAISCPVMGDFNAQNVLASICTALALGYSFEHIVQVVHKIQPVVGRMQMVELSDDLPTVIIDYAHTPQALESALRALRKHMTLDQSLYCVFGCGGDRDSGKRALMGNIAEQYADVVVLTDDNPRTESPEAIFEAVLSGVSNPEVIHAIHSRQQAIEYALAHASKVDLILIAGKGHEDYQIIGVEKLPFIDEQVVIQAADKIITENKVAPC